MLNVLPLSRSTQRIAFLFWSLLILPAVASAQTTLSAVWDSNSSSDRVSNYEVCIGTSSLSCNIELATVSGSASSYEFRPPAGQLVYVAVRAVNAAGRSAYSTEQRFSIPAIGSLTNLSTLVSALITPISLTVSDPDGSRLTYSHTGLPPGVSINSSTGQITGTPTSSGIYNVTIFVNDGLTTVSRSFTWTVLQAATPDRTAPALSIASHTSGQVVTTASQTISGTATDSGNGGSGISAVRVNGQSASGGTASGNNSANWSRAITLTSGSNTISVEAVDGAGNIQMRQITLQLTVPSSPPPTSPPPTTSGGPLTLATLTASQPSPAVTGTSITFNATASGGKAPYQFKWWLYDGTAWTIVKNWGSSSTYTWTPTKPGSDYIVGVWVRDSTMTSDIGTYNRSMTYVISSATSGSSSSPLTISALGASRVSPQPVGTSITFTAAASGGRSPYQYKWWLFDGSVWKVLANWSTSATYTWTPTVADSDYVVAVWVRDSTMTSDIGTYNRSLPFPISAASSGGSSSTPAPLAVTALGANRVSPQAVGTSITFTATAAGGIGPYQFKWWLYDGTAWTIVKDWGSSSTYTWTPTKARSDYIIGVWVRDSTMKTDVGTYNRSITYVISSGSGGTTTSAPLSVSSLSASHVSPQRIGTSITFTAGATGGRSPYQFKWWLYDGTTWKMVRDWNASATYTWTPEQPGSAYQIGVWVRDSTMTTDIGTYNRSMAFAITGTVQPLQITSLTSNLASPQPAGTRVTFTATATGGRAPYEYKWWVFDGTAWIVARDWSSSSTYTWTALPRGSNYYVAVWVRDSTTKANVGDVYYSVPFVTR